MRKFLRLGLFFVLLIPVSLLRAQEFKSGFMLGVSATQVDGDNLSGYNKLGPHLGIFVERMFGDKFGIRPEFLFTIKGAKNYVDIDNTANPFKSSFYYVEVPLFFNYRIKKFQIETGPSFGVLMYAYNSDNSGKYVTTDKYNRMEWAAHLGVSYRLKESMLLYGRYSYSMACVDGGNCGALFTSPKYRPGYFHNVISVGMRRYFGT
ncbi:MAG: porin family protein [Bacteroidia bacterium]